MAAKFTPGPWHVSKGRRVVWVKAGHQNVAGVYMGSYPARYGETDLANARLIAAAPELLDALDRLLNWPRVFDGLRAEDVAFARAAIAKATGEQS